MILVIFFIFPVELKGRVYVTCYIVILYPCNMKDTTLLKRLQIILEKEDNNPNRKDDSFYLDISELYDMLHYDIMTDMYGKGDY